MLYTLSSTEKENWQKVIDKCTIYDFYHTAHYHRLSEKRKEGRALLIVFEEDMYTICLPLLSRNINEIKDFENYHGTDMTSVYGYAGPIKSHEEIPESVINSFRQEFNQFFLQEKIISVFSRLHPLIDNNFILSGLGEILTLGNTISIDLTLPLDEQRRRYRKRYKTKINQLRRTGIVCKKAKTKDEIDSFISIYKENMKKFNAKSQYLFSNEYFYDFLQSEDFESFVIIAVLENEILGGVLFTITNNIIQYHLATTSTN